MVCFTASVPTMQQSVNHVIVTRHSSSSLCDDDALMMTMTKLTNRSTGIIGLLTFLSTDKWSMILIGVAVCLFVSSLIASRCLLLDVMRRRRLVDNRRITGQRNCLLFTQLTEVSGGCYALPTRHRTGNALQKFIKTVNDTDRKGQTWPCLITESQVCAFAIQKQ